MKYYTNPTTGGVSEASDGVTMAPGWVEVTKAAYDLALDVVVTSNVANAAAMVATADANRHADYVALVAAGIPQATAARLTGWTV